MELTAMPLRTDMSTRQDARPGTGDEQHATVYDPQRGGWHPPEPPAPTTRFEGE